jgi:amino-acid N-acetyltransferase
MLLIDPARRDDLPAIESLLTECGLPTEGVAALLEHILVARTGNRLVGCAAVEPHGDACVLRSLAVAPASRGRGVARPLIEAALAHAAAIGAREAYLLTHTIESMARRFGFERIERDDVPPDLLREGEFRLTLCSKATVMRKELRNSLDSPVHSQV